MSADTTRGFRQPTTVTVGFGVALPAVLLIALNLGAPPLVVIAVYLVGIAAWIIASTSEGTE